MCVESGLPADPITSLCPLTHSRLFYLQVETLDSDVADAFNYLIKEFDELGFVKDYHDFYKGLYSTRRLMKLQLNGRDSIFVKTKTAENGSRIKDLLSQATRVLIEEAFITSSFNKEGLTNRTLRAILKRLEQAVTWIEVTK